MPESSPSPAMPSETTVTGANAPTMQSTLTYDAAGTVDKPEELARGVLCVRVEVGSDGTLYLIPRDQLADMALRNLGDGVKMSWKGTMNVPREGDFMLNEVGFRPDRGPELRSGQKTGLIGLYDRRPLTPEQHAACLALIEPKPVPPRPKKRRRSK